LTAIMAIAGPGNAGIALGTWGAVDASAAGLAVAAGGLLKDFVTRIAAHGGLGDGLASAAAGYGVVYHLEILLLFATLVALGPLVRRTRAPSPPQTGSGLAGLSL
jgi:BCD family chlorophyll transporter-like MFS transporter